MRETENTEEQDVTAPLWDIAGTTQVLRAQSTIYQHALLGAGTRLTLQEAGGPDAPRLDLFPERLVIRYHDKLAHMQLVGVSSVRPEQDHVLILAADQDLTATVFV